MATRRIQSFVCLGVTLLATAWLVFSASMIGQTLLPDDRTLVMAHEGAEMRVSDGTLHVLAGSAGVVAYDPLLIAAMALPFGLIVVMSLIGCLLLFRTGGRDGD